MEGAAILHTLPETNRAPENHPRRKLVFQPSIFRGYVSFREGTYIGLSPLPATVASEGL